MRKQLVAIGSDWYRLRYAVVACSILALAGCETTLPSEMSHTQVKQLAQQIVQRCLDQGVQPQTREMDVCTNHEARREVNTRYNNRAAILGAASGIQSAADNYNQASQQRPVTCTSRATGPTVRTTCY